MRIRRGFTNQATTNQDQIERPETGSLANRQHAGAGAIAIRVARQAPPSGGNLAESSPPLPEPDPTRAAADNANGQAKCKMAILIDAENQPGQRIGPVFAALERDFDVSVRRAYADWENPVLRSWLQTCHDQDIERVQVDPSPGLVKVKNRADVALSEDAIALSDERRLDAVCIVSGDSDFLPVVRSLQAKGLFVVGAEALGRNSKRRAHPRVRSLVEHHRRPRHGDYYNGTPRCNRPRCERPSPLGRVSAQGAVATGSGL